MIRISKNNSVTIQIKNNTTKKSRAFTIYGENEEIAYVRLTFLYECFEKGKEVLIIKNEQDSKENK